MKLRRKPQKTPPITETHIDQPRPSWTRRFRVWLRNGFAALLAVCCAVVFYAAVILGETPAADGADEAGGQEAAIQATPAPLPGGQALGSTDLSAIAAYFPGRMARIAESSGVGLSQATVQDATVAGNKCRIVTLRYEVMGEAIALHSATPSAFLQRYVTNDMALSSESLSMGLLSAVLLRSGGQQTMLAQYEGAVYALEAPLDSAILTDLAAWVVYE